MARPLREELFFAASFIGVEKNILIDFLFVYLFYNLTSVKNIKTTAGFIMFHSYHCTNTLEYRREL